MTPKTSRANPFLRTAVLLAMIAVAVASRLVPHPPNFTPVGAMAIFGGACFLHRWAAFIVPLLALFISDIFIGVDFTMPVVYGSVALNVVLGRWLRVHRNMASTALVTLLGSVQFFLLTNLAAWLMLYPHTWAGLTECYVAAIPFFQNTLLGDAVFVTVLFGGLSLAEAGFPILRERSPKAAWVT